MKIFIAQQNYVIGDFKLNSSKIIEVIDEARKAKADLVVFSEMSVCGYPAEDLLLSESFIQDCHQFIHQIKEHTRNIAVLIGAPERAAAEGENKLFNSAYFLYNREILNIVRKLNTGASGRNHDSEYFEASLQEKGIIAFKEKNIAIIIGEMWKNTLDSSLDSSNLKRLQNADIAINISASVFDYTATAGKKEYLKQLAFESGTPIVYCNAAGAQAGIILEGGSMVFDYGGYLSLSLKRFEEDKALITISDSGACAAESIEPVGILPDESFNIDQFTPNYNISQIRKALITGIKDYFNKLGLKKAVIGNSGGIDSAVTTALATEALGKKNVFTLLMPSTYSSRGSISDGEQLCKNLRIGYEIIPIKSVFSKFIQTLEPIFKDAAADVTEENIQARIRAILLMAMANKFRYVLLNTSNKSELCVGYGTMYGDLAGGLSVLGDCYKMQIYELAKDINHSKEIIPQNTIDKAPSAELHQGQLDSDTLPRYDVLDRILYQYIDRRKPIHEITGMGYREDIVKKVINMVNKNEFKRHQFCPIIGISPVPFGIGRKIPIVAKYSE